MWMQHSVFLYFYSVFGSGSSRQGMGVLDREWEFKVSDTLNPLIDSKTWELRREWKEELTGLTPSNVFHGDP